MKLTYYPGCSLLGMGIAYDESIRQIFKSLSVELEDLDDWNCCGATAYMAVNETAAYALAARNLCRAEKQISDGSIQDVIAPCAACYLVLNKAQHLLEEDCRESKNVKFALDAAGLEYKGEVKVRHPLDVIANDIGLDKIKERVVKPLDGLKVACYYGCQMVRPYATFDDQFEPMEMDHLVESLGGEPVDWPLKTRCCGGSLTGTIQEIGLRLNYILLHEAKSHGAQVIATACPLCHFNLDAYQDQISRKFGNGYKMPIVYFSQLMGKAFGIGDEDLGLNRHFVPFESPIAPVQGERNA